MESSESFGDLDEVKETFVFYHYERIPGIIDLLCIFVYMALFRIPGTHAVD
ncbi:hypothetical protein LCL89_05660 [Halobacillus yeomjeoni]|uniref:hypothetical protein n=1 Tax=Halobacillus yeomjeoni TaxID=311194 RepID=UPI001CD59BAB|nr:hypothetical protein [Halobacillus yeomjeoni]MCA0983539.1 hypothetical protein [Halobacillus yeomjeoni]